MTGEAPDSKTLSELAGYTTPSISNGIERFDLRSRSVGFADGTVRCIFPELGTAVGFAATARISSRDGGPRVDRALLWEHVLSVPAPRLVVIEDVDDPPGHGSFWGEVNANVFRALGAIGLVTNGGVRDLAEMEALGFQAFAASICVSHAYVGVVEVGVPVTVGGLAVDPGDLLHGDRHGVISIPPEVAADLPAAVRQVEAEERQLIALCQSPDFTLEKLITFTRPRP
jgi:regulator of RNase E activity RraA